MGAEPNSAPQLSMQPEAIYSSAFRNSVFGWRNQAWLLKNSISQNWSKNLCARKPYKRLFRFSETFPIPYFFVVLRKMDFFNSHRR